MHVQEANTEMIILPVLVRGMDDVHTQAELLAEAEQISLGDTVAFISIQEAGAMAAKARIHARTAYSSKMLKDDRRNIKDSTEDDVTQSKAAEHVETVKMQLTVNINTNIGPATSINQILRQNEEPPEGHTARGCYHGRTPTMKNAPDKAHPQTHAVSRGGKRMPVAGVMRQQGIPRLTSAGTSARGQSQPPTRTHANN